MRDSLGRRYNKTDRLGMVRKSTAEALGRNPATAISIVAPSGLLTEPEPAHEGDSGCGGGTSCGGAGSAKLEW